MDLQQQKAMMVFFEQILMHELEKIVDENDKEKSSVTTYKAIDFLLRVRKELDKDYKFNNVEDLIVSVYGKDFLELFKLRYNEEICYYNYPEKSFEEIFGS